MAIWTTIPDSSIEPGKPIRSIDGIALRDNPIAIAEGAAGAPKIENAAHLPPIAGSTHIIMRLQEAEVSTDQGLYLDVGLNNRHSSFQHLGVTVLVAGVIRCSLRHRRLTGGASEVRILKNGSVIQTWSTTSNSNVTQAVDVSVDVGDVVIFQNRGVLAGSTSFWSQLRILSDNLNMAVA